MADTLLEARGLTRRFGAALALDALDLAIRPGEFFALLGGSGSGKSTLLRLIAGLDAPDGGALFLDGRDITADPPWARPLHMMFQSYALFPHMSVAENVGYGLRRVGVARGEQARRIAEALALVKLDGLGARRPHHLSGGQRQRVALARSLVMRPRLLLLDEPLAALDAGLREQTGFELRALQRQTGAAFVMVTHDQEEALALADRIAVLEGGRLVQVGTPEEVYWRPATAFVARFLGAANIVEPATLPLKPQVAGAAAYALRPEYIRLTRIGGASDSDLRAIRPSDHRTLGHEETGPNRVMGVVREAAFRGDSTLFVVALEAGGALRVTVHADDPMPAMGERVALAWDPDDLAPLAA
ncbi:ABC transporter ATP-binding protein [Plastoroseomonas hellenica]|uniref:ABC transporter ATP-binding protein n=1 Tax=Plastoroseomonas hellenica TaxID=2687306 RepID=UPI001BA60317|nr:ABC transporter ATP-binding protein [Plastoroseomonas hellenica]MBR0642409.1 ABC transporter ATP-binding protein [Plastoroseomonas hellenica]